MEKRKIYLAVLRGKSFEVVDLTIIEDENKK